MVVMVMTHYEHPCQVCFSFFPVLLVLLLMLNVYIIIHYLAVKPKRKKKRCTRNIMMKFLEKKHDRSMQYKEDALEVEKRRLDAMEKQVDVMRDALCYLVMKTEQ